jgi:hypothetical protein
MSDAAPNRLTAHVGDVGPLEAIAECDTDLLILDDGDRQILVRAVDGGDVRVEVEDGDE